MCPVRWRTIPGLVGVLNAHRRTLNHQRDVNCCFVIAGSSPRVAINPLQRNRQLSPAKRA